LKPEASRPEATGGKAIANSSGKLHQRETGGQGPAASATLVRAIQRELTRRGCYTGKIDGKWGPASRKAASQFVRKSNKNTASRPNPAFLAALKADKTARCNATRCAAGMKRSNTGKCVRQARRAPCNQWNFRE